MKLQTTGKSLEALAFGLSLTGMIFCVICMSGRSWEHGYGYLPEIHRPTRPTPVKPTFPPKPTPNDTDSLITDILSSFPASKRSFPPLSDDEPEPVKPQKHRDVYFGPFDDCGKHSTHTAECSKMFTCRLLLISAILHFAIPYIVDRVPFCQTKCGMPKLKCVVGFNWIAGSILMIATLSLFDVFIRKDNASFFREETDGHNFDDIVTWRHGAAYNFGWIGASLNLVAGAIYMVIGWKFY